MTDSAYEDRDDEREARDEAEQHLREERERERPGSDEDEQAVSRPNS
jgi:hypothetical protein